MSDDATPARDDRANRATPRWEYMRKTVGPREAMTGFALDFFGNQGWELVAIAREDEYSGSEPTGRSSSCYVFKRPQRPA